MTIPCNTPTIKSLLHYYHSDLILILLEECSICRDYRCCALKWGRGQEHQQWTAAPAMVACTGLEKWVSPENVQQRHPHWPVPSVFPDINMAAAFSSVTTPRGQHEVSKLGTPETPYQQLANCITHSGGRQRYPLTFFFPRLPTSEDSWVSWPELRNTNELHI